MIFLLVIIIIYDLFNKVGKCFSTGNQRTPGGPQLVPKGQKVEYITLIYFLCCIDISFKIFRQKFHFQIGIRTLRKKIHTFCRGSILSYTFFTIAPFR